LQSRALEENFPGEGGRQQTKDPKIAKTDRKIALLILFQGGNGKKTKKIAKKTNEK